MFRAIFSAGAIFTLILTTTDTARAADEPPAEMGFEPKVVERIISGAREKNDAWRKLVELCDRFGPRASGSENLEKAILWAIAEMKKDGYDRVVAEPVMVPRWVRGEESLTMHTPRATDLPMLGLGLSVGTPPEGITAEVLAFPDRESLEKLGPNAAAGKIVLFNRAMRPYDPQRGSDYGVGSRYRTRGATWAAKAGAVACLVRSATARSLRSPHTGAMRYADDSSIPRIPAAAVTLEDADMIERMCARGETVRVTLKMGARDEGMVPSANVVGELRGREKPDEIVLISGHFDSWDVGQGAHDDGAACIACIEAVSLLKRLDLRPRRTIRVVLWTNEEAGLRGARKYLEDHLEEMPKHIAALESDSGMFPLRGLSVQHLYPQKEAFAARRLRKLVEHLRPIRELRVRSGWSGADVGQLIGNGVTCIGVSTQNDTYFDYHHTHADTVDKIDPDALTEHVAGLAAMAYMLAEMPDRLDAPTRK